VERRGKAWLNFAATRLGGFAADVFALGVAYVGAILLRFDLHAPRWGWGPVAASFVSVVLVQLLSLGAFGCYRLAWRRTQLKDLPRYFFSALAACAVLTLMRFFLPLEAYVHVRPPYSVTLIDFFLAFAAVVGWRIVWSWFWTARTHDETLIERRVRELPVPVAFFRDKTVMVTGAGGSIGAEIVRQVAAAGVRRVLLVERGENALYEIDREMRQRGTNAELLPLMKDVNDRAAMERIFAEHRPEIVLHAAAYKHVPMVEMNPEEGRRNNTEATAQLGALAKRYGVVRFVLISTDKAVNPVSEMGRTKRAAEQAIMALNAQGTTHEARGTTSFCAVRFGNVFGSSGSVVPLFREQIARHLPVTVTHPDMERYFMTVSEAVGLVLQAASRSENAIYTLDMGASVRILDLAEGMIRHAGYRPYVDIPIVFTGIRPGEKLREELDISEQSAVKTDMAKIYVTKVEVEG